MVIAYLRKYVSYYGTVNTTIDHMLSSCGYRTSGNYKDSVLTFKEILNDMQCNNLINIELDIKDISNTKMFTINILTDELFVAKSSGYVKLYMSEFDKIMDSDCKNKQQIVLSYLYIKQYIYNGKHSNELSVPSINVMQKTLNIKCKKTLYSYINELINLGMLYKDDNKYYVKHDDSIIRTKTVFSINPDNLKYARQELESMYHSKVFTKKPD